MAEFARTKLDSVLRRALELSTDERERFLDETCDRDTGLRAAVERMLKDCEADDLLLQPGGGASGPLWEALARDYSAAFAFEPGERVGAYRIVRVLGRGGMATVYLAERADGQFEQTVALKVLDVSRDFNSLSARFAQERQILARLEHPNIARLIGGGATRTGQPYVVMEYVDGEPIDQYCDRRRLSVEERIALFADVAGAVQYAHSHLIVHRDIKPSNILVNANGEPKLLDFGIAKLLDPTTPHAAPETHSALHPMTPEYASPEQVRGLPLTIASDVYQLGYLLFQLLTGCAPYGFGRRSVADTVRLICTVDPLRPSQIVMRVASNDDNDTTAERLAAARSTTPERLRRRLAGDLDNILLTALRKEPEQRYPSILHLRDDLQRHLDGRPVSAHAATLRYRTVKFVGRNRASVAAAALVVLALLAGLAATTWQAGVAREQAQLAREAALQARTQTRRAQRVKDFLFSIFREQDPLARDDAQSRTPQRLVAEAAIRLETELRDEPDVRAELLGDLGEIAFNLGNMEDANKLLEQALAEYQALFGPQDPRAAEILRILSEIRSEEGQRDEAEQLAREALAVLAQHGTLETVEVARVKERLANAIGYGRTATPEAFALIASAQSIFESELGPDHPLSAQALYFHARLLEQARRDAEAEPMLREVIDRLERAQGPGTIRLRNPLEALGIILRRRGQLDEAVASHLRSIEISRRQLGSPHPTITRGFIRLANVYEIMHRYPDAERALLEAEAALPEGFVTDRSELLKDRGQLYIKMGRAEDAERDLSQAFELQQSSVGEENGYTWFTASEWGRALAALGRVDEAEALQRRALKRLSEIMGPDAYQNALLGDALAATLERSQDNREALALRRRSLALTEASYPRTHRLWAERALSLAQTLAAIGTAESRQEAASLLDRSVEVFRDPDAAGPELGIALLERGRVQLALGQREAASNDFTEAIPLLEHSHGASDALSREAHSLLAEVP
jgi:serine/threonine-protein kinase